MSSNGFTIKRLGPGDVAVMEAMMTMFGKAFDDPQSYTKERPSSLYTSRLLDRSHFIALAAVEGGTVIGGLVAYELMKFEQERSEIYIYDLAVDEAHRRKGVASGLIAALQTIAIEMGAWVIYVQADYGDDPAIALYTKLGTREDVMHFDIDVP